MKKSLLTFTCTGILALVFTFSLATSASADVSAGDKMFVMKAAQGGMTEVDLGQAASSQASSQDIKDFGARMVTDHGKANDELKSIAQSKGVDVPAALDAKHQKMVDKIKGMSGAGFDKSYVAAMIKAHKTDDALFSKEASSGSDPDLKAFASKTDMVIKDHLKMIEDIQSKMGK